MEVDRTVLGSGHSSASKCSVDFVQLVCPILEQSESADRFSRCSDAPVWKQLIDRPLTTDEHASLIADLFSNRGEIEALKILSESDAQSFIDAIDQVPPLSRQNGGSTDLNPNPPVTALSRCWMVWCRGFGGSVWPHCAGYAATTL